MACIYKQACPYYCGYDIYMATVMMHTTAAIVIGGVGTRAEGWAHAHIPGCGVGERW